MLCIVNFKAYKSASGVHSVKLAKICEKVAHNEKVQIAVAVQPSDIFQVATNVRIPVLSQHVDPIDFGSHTGWILPESILQAGAIGSIINHSEHLIPMEYIQATVKRLKKLGLLSVVCARTPAKAIQIAKFKPDIIAIEPPELVGGDVSISKAKPELITKTTHAIRNIPVLCGAGINTKKDVKKAVQLGAKGILIAHSITKAKNPEKVLTLLVQGFK